MLIVLVVALFVGYWVVYIVAGLMAVVADKTVLKSVTSVPTPQQLALLERKLGYSVARHNP